MIIQRAMMSRFCLLLFIAGATSAAAPEPISKIPRRLPPPGIALPEDRRTALESKVRELGERVDRLRDHPLQADVAIYHKALDYALRHGEFFKEKNDLKTALGILDQASNALAQLERENLASTREHGLLVRGYRSSIDNSVQPYGLEVPEGLDLNRPVPLYVWLHGRGDTRTDLYFIAERLAKPGKFAFEDGIVLHPFGRQCIGWKSAGEIDVLEAIEDVQKRYPIDEDRVALMGFSMGGAGAWHLGAHYTERWAVIHAGAGFAETARYNNLAQEDYPAWYEQRLWGLYDVPHYARNLLNLPVIAYSGEVDKQIQAARVMEEAFAAHGAELVHVIGPGMGHEYHSETQTEVAAFVRDALARGRDRFPQKIALQTRTLRYPSMHWVRIEGLIEHWKDSRIDAEVESESNLRLTTKNVSELRLQAPWGEGAAFSADCVLEVDGWKLRVEDEAESLILHRTDQGWDWGPLANQGTLRKIPGLQGPIDDAFLEPFLVVLPTGKSSHAAVEQWIAFELDHFRERWRAVFRGDLRLKRDDEVTPQDVAQYHLILWGTPESNRVTQRLFDLDQIPISWDDKNLTVGGKEFSSGHHVLAAIYPNPENPGKYVVFNSGPTFRENHDRTNSLQNPKLPDWAVIDLLQPPDAEAPGKTAAADFFDESWGVKPGGTSKE